MIYLLCSANISDINSRSWQCVTTFHRVDQDLSVDRSDRLVGQTCVEFPVILILSFTVISGSITPLIATNYLLPTVTCFGVDTWPWLGRNIMDTFNQNVSHTAGCEIAHFQLIWSRISARLHDDHWDRPLLLCRCWFFLCCCHWLARSQPLGAYAFGMRCTQSISSVDSHHVSDEPFIRRPATACRSC